MISWPDDEAMALPSACKGVALSLVVRYPNLFVDDLHRFLGSYHSTRLEELQVI
jgi:hypothetical protein